MDDLRDFHIVAGDFFVWESYTDGHLYVYIGVAYIANPFLFLPNQTPHADDDKECTDYSRNGEILVGNIEALYLQIDDN